MEGLILVTGLAIAIGLSGFFLIVRKKDWCTNFLRFGITGVFFIIGFVGLIVIENPTKYQRLLLIWMQIPILNGLIDRFFRLLSLKIHKRDILLYMRGSDDLDYSFKNSDIKTSDYVFSVLLIILLFTLPLIGFMK